MLNNESIMAIANGCIVFVVSSIIRSLFYINMPISTAEKLIKTLSWFDMRKKSLETVSFLCQCMGPLWIIFGLAYGSIVNNFEISAALDDILVFGLMFGPLFLVMLILFFLRGKYWSHE